jgi:YVTN family beta-propeller protein
MLRETFAAALAAVLLGAQPHRAAPLAVYAAPAGIRPAGASPIHPTDAVLPDGRIGSPLGVAAFVGTDPLAVAISPDGRFALVGNAEQSAASAAAQPAPGLVAGYSLAVVSTATMRVTSVYASPAVAFFTGLAVVADPASAGATIVLAADGAHNAVRVFDLAQDGTLHLEPSAIEVRGYPGAITVSADGRFAYVASDLADTVSAIDIAARRIVGGAPTGYGPDGVVRAGDKLYVSNGGLASYRTLPSRLMYPRFVNVSTDPYKASSLSVFPVGADGNVNPDPSAANTVRLDPVPDGIDAVGGAHPSAIVARRDGAYAYVTLANVDRVSTVALDGDPHVVGGLDLRLFVEAPYGTQPSAAALSPDGKRLYVALAGLNAVAVLDASTPSQLHRLGLIPTGWYPSALAISPDGRYLYVTAAKGVDGWGLLQRVDLKALPLVKATLSALRYNRSAAPVRANAVVPPLRTAAKSNVIDRVVCIVVGNATFDEVFGDLGRANADPALVQYGASITPNLHALAQAYGISDNFYVGDLDADANEQIALSGIATLYANQTLHVNDGRAPLDAHAQDPEDYPRAGYLFNALARAGMSYRDYGGMLRLSGYEPASLAAPRRGHATVPEQAPGLGGSYGLDVPALAALADRVDLTYPGWNPAIPDAARAAAFSADFGSLVQSDEEPAFTYVWVPADGPAGMADADRAVGAIVASVTAATHWSSTAIFIVGNGVGDGRDHVNRARGFALVVSPLAKPGYIGHQHITVAGVVKTEEELLGLPPLSLPDLLATDLADFFGDVPYPTRYQALP